MMTSLKMSSENLEIKLCLWNIFFNASINFCIKILLGCILPQVFFKLIWTGIILFEDLEIFKIQVFIFFDYFFFVTSEVYKSGCLEVHNFIF